MDSARAPWAEAVGAEGGGGRRRWGPKAEGMRCMGEDVPSL